MTSAIVTIVLLAGALAAVVPALEPRVACFLTKGETVEPPDAAAYWAEVAGFVASLGTPRT